MESVTVSSGSKASLYGRPGHLRASRRPHPAGCGRFEGLGCPAVIPGRVPPGVPRVARTYQSPAEPALFEGLSNNQINPLWHKMNRGEAAPLGLLRAHPPRPLGADKGATPEVTSHRQISPAFGKSKKQTLEAFWSQKENDRPPGMIPLPPPAPRQAPEFKVGSDPNVPQGRGRLPK